MRHPHTVHPRPVIGREIPLSGLVPLQSVTRASPCHRDASLAASSEEPTPHSATPSQSFRGLFPFSVFPTTQSYIVPKPTKASVMLRPQGFAPSRRFAPRVISRAYFIPVPLLGFTLRGIPPSATPYALSDTATFMGFPLNFEKLRRVSSSNAPLQGMARLRKHHHGFGVNRGPRSDYLLEFGSFEVSCPSQPPACFDRRSPHVLCRPRRKLTKSLAPQGLH